MVRTRAMERQPGAAAAGEFRRPTRGSAWHTARLMYGDWQQRWDQGNINFHRREVHPALLRHWLPRTGTVLVPLCGKSVDLRWLAERGHRVIGVELVERAVRDFFAEQQLAFDRRDGALAAFVARDLPITIWQGDFFALTDMRCDALWDRAALVALPLELRRAYAKHADSLLAPNAFRLLVTLEYDQQLVQGPPFSVPANEVLDYWPNLELLDRREAVDETPPKFRAAGATLAEAVWRSPVTAR